MRTPVYRSQQSIPVLTTKKLQGEQYLSIELILYSYRILILEGFLFEARGWSFSVGYGSLRFNIPGM
jgi:hypothetical protein